MAMVYDAADGGPLREPDNITVHAPSGQVFVAEDNDDLQLVLLSEQGDEWAVRSRVPGIKVPRTVADSAVLHVRVTRRCPG